MLILSACAPKASPAQTTQGTPVAYQDFGYYLTWSPDDNLLAVTSNTGLYVYDTKSHAQLAAFDKLGGSTAAFSQHYISAVNQDGMYVWELKDYKLLFQQKAENKTTFQSLAISPDEKILATGEQNQIRLWGIPDGSLIATLNNIGFVTDVKFKDNDTLIAASPYLGKVQEWDIKNQTMRRSFEFPKPVLSLRLSEDAKELIVDYGNTGFELWNVDAGKIQQNYGDIASATGWQRLSRNKQYVVVWGYAFDEKNSGMSVWDMSIHMHVQEFTTPFVRGDGWRCGALNSDGSILAASNNEGYIKFYDVASGEELGRIYLPYKFSVFKG